MMFSSFLVSVHSSLLYRKILPMYMLNVRSLMLMLIFLDLKMFCIDFIAAIARVFLLLISFSVSSRLPSNLQVFQASSPLFDILYSSVFVSFTWRFLLSRVFGAVLFTSSILCFAVVAHVVSSAYFGSISK